MHAYVICSCASLSTPSTFALPHSFHTRPADAYPTPPTAYHNNSNNNKCKGLNALHIHTYNGSKLTHMFTLWSLWLDNTWISWNWVDLHFCCIMSCCCRCRFCEWMWYWGLQLAKKIRLNCSVVIYVCLWQQQQQQNKSVSCGQQSVESWRPASCKTV